VKKSKKLTPAEKLKVVLNHHLISSRKRSMDDVRRELRKSGASSENIRQWTQQLHERSGDVYEDRRKRRRLEDVEKKCERLTDENEDLRRQLQELEGGGEFDPDIDA